MNDVPVTLKQFFLFHGEEPLSRESWLSLDEGEQVTRLRQNLKKEAKGLNWTRVLGEITQKIDDLLDISLESILVGAWNKYRDLLKYCDPVKYPGNETVLVHLVEHTITSEHHPYLAVLVNDLEVGKIDFTINLALTVKGAILKIRGGKILEILPGECKGKGTVACEKCIIFKEETKSFKVPYSIKLGEGIPILP
jgi:hypothetical protein